MNIELVNGTAQNVDEACRRLDQTIEALETIPFFGQQKLIYLKDVNFTGDSVIGRSEAVLERLERLALLLGQIDPSEAVLLMSSDAIDKRRTFYKKLTAAADLQTFDKLDLSRTRDFESWCDEVERRIHEKGLKAGSRVVERLIELSWNDARALDNEIEKLSLYVYPKNEVTEEDVKAIGSSSREMIIWDLCQAVTVGQPSEALRLLRQLLAQGESEIGLLILLGGQVRLAALGMYLYETKRLVIERKGSFVTSRLERDGEELLPKNKKGEAPNLYRMAQIVQQAKERPSSLWFQAIEQVHQTHLKLMEGKVDRQEALEALVVDIACLKQ